MTQEQRDEEKSKTSGFEAARPRLTSIAYRMLGSRAEAEDVVQDAWLKWHAASAGDLRTPLAWLTTVTTRLAIDRIRRLRSEQAVRSSESLMQPWLDEWAPSAEDEVLRSASVAQAIAVLFDRLSPDERAAFVLHEAFDCDYAQIAEVVGKTPAHCRQLAHRARQRLMNVQAHAANGERRDRALADALGGLHIERLREAIREADVAGAMRLVADRPVEIAAAAGAGIGSVTAARAAAAWAMASTEGASLEAHALPPDWGAAFLLVRACEVVGLVRIDSEGAFTLVTNGADVDALNRRFGACAIARLLARIADTATTVTACIA